MRIRFWGTRGSIAKPGPSTLRYGGNTACVEVESADGTLVVIDCGTGAHELAQHLLLSGRLPLRAHLLVSHTHWDHIQGFPFFDPLFDGANHWDVYAPGGRSKHLQASLEGQMSYDYHPVTLDALAGSARFHDLTEGSFEAGSIRITTQYLNHPALTLGYRLEADGATVVYASDHEPHTLQPVDARPGTPPVHEEDRRHVSFLHDADLVIHDAQYTLEDFPTKAGWGHTPVEQAVDYALAAGARRLALFHHDPLRDDAAVDRLEEMARKRARDGGGELEVFAAWEGQILHLGRLGTGDRANGREEAVQPSRSAMLPPSPSLTSTVLLVDDDDDTRREVASALEEERVRLLHARDAEEAVAIARRERPSLVVVDLRIPGGGGLAVCRALRGEAEPRLRDLPILVVDDTEGADAVAEAFRAGATDYLSWPVKPTLLRARVRSWLLRTGAGQADPLR